MDIISYNEIAVDSKMANHISQISEILSLPVFESDPALKRFITKLAAQYNNYKSSFNFPTKFKSKYFLTVMLWSLSCQSPFFPLDHLKCTFNVSNVHLSYYKHHCL